MMKCDITWCYNMGLCAALQRRRTLRVPLNEVERRRTKSNDVERIRTKSIEVEWRTELQKNHLENKASSYLGSDVEGQGHPTLDTHSAGYWCFYIASDPEIRHVPTVAEPFCHCHLFWKLPTCSHSLQPCSGVSPAPVVTPLSSQVCYSQLPPSQGLGPSSSFKCCSASAFTRLFRCCFWRWGDMAALQVPSSIYSSMGRRCASYLGFNEVNDKSPVFDYCNVSLAHP